MTNLLKRVEDIKKREASLKEEIADLERQKKEEADRLSSDLKKTLEEIFLEEKEKFEKVFQKKDLEEFLQGVNTKNKQTVLNSQNPSDSYRSPISSFYDKVKEISTIQNPSEAQREFLKEIAYNLDKAKTSGVYDPKDYVSRIESLVKKSSSVDLYDLDAKPY